MAIGADGTFSYPNAMGYLGNAMETMGRLRLDPRVRDKRWSTLRAEARVWYTWQRHLFSDWHRHRRLLDGDTPYPTRVRLPSR